MSRSEMRSSARSTVWAGCRTPSSGMRSSAAKGEPHVKIDHLINGKPVTSRSYFETVNPATQEVLAEVASGSATEVDAAVAAAKAAFPAWAGRPAAERAALLRRLGDLIAHDVPALAHTETQDTGQPIAQTSKQLVPRAADNFY